MWFTLLAASGIRVVVHTKAGQRELCSAITTGRGHLRFSRSGAVIGLSHPLPEAPWFQRGSHWSARRVLLHVIAETAQHAGHADIIRESLDGAKTMG